MATIITVLGEEVVNGIENVLTCQPSAEDDTASLVPDTPSCAETDNNCKQISHNPAIIFIKITQE